MMILSVVKYDEEGHRTIIGEARITKNDDGTIKNFEIEFDDESEAGPWMFATSPDGARELARGNLLPV